MSEPKNPYLGKNKKRPYNIMIRIGLLLTVVGILLLVYSNSLWKVSLILFGLSAILFFIAWVGKSGLKDDSRKICDKCGQSMWGCKYEYMEKYRTSESAFNGAVAIDVWIRAECPHCGQVKEFVQSFYVGPKSDSIQYQVEQFCRDKFGH